MPYPKVAQLETAEDFLRRLAKLEIELPFRAELAPPGSSPLAQELSIRDGGGRELVAGNRFTVLPMEGWDGELDGRPSPLVLRRWRRFGGSGAKLIWGEATAVRPDGRANPNQLVMSPETTAPIAHLREELVAAHRETCGETRDLVIGLQLTHSGRWARPEGEPRPRTAYRHSLLDRRVGIDSDSSLLGDSELDQLVLDFVAAAVLAAEAGFDFVDVKHCHGYLLHELLSARERHGAYGGDLEHRTRFLRRVVAGIRNSAPGLALAVRLSAFDFVPFHAGDGGVGEVEEPPSDHCEYLPFGGDTSGTGVDLTEPDRLLSLLEELGVGLVCLTAGSPYYCPHIQRPAYYPPSDGYLPPEDPLVGVARLLGATAELKRLHPQLAVVGSGYSYLQEWLPHVAEAAVEQGGVDSVGLGRVALSYPDLPRDVLAGKRLERRGLCRTFSDCTTAPRHGLVSGCYPLDPFYRERPEREEVRRIKAQQTP